MNKLNEVAQLVALADGCRGPGSREPSKLHRDIYHLHARLENLADALAREDNP